MVFEALCFLGAAHSGPMDALDDLLGILQRGAAVTWSSELFCFAYRDPVPTMQLIS